MLLFNIYCLYSAFESRSLSIEEPQTTDSKIFDIPVIRQGGTKGVISLQWRASVKGIHLHCVCMYVCVHVCVCF